MNMKDRPKEIHVWSEGEYVGNIIYTHKIPRMSEEELTDIILETFPRLKGKRWNIRFI